MNKKLCLILLLLISLLIPFTVVKAEVYQEKQANNEYQLIIEDDTNTFTNENFDSISSGSRKILNKGNVYLKIVKSTGDMEYLKSVVLTNYNQKFGDMNGVMILLNIYDFESVPEDTDPNDKTTMLVKAFGDIKVLVPEDKEQSIYTEQNNHMRETSRTKSHHDAYTHRLMSALSELDYYISLDNNLIAEKTTNKLIIEDDANLLSEEEEKRLEDVMSPLTEYGYIVFKSIDDNDLSVEAYAANYYYNHFGNESGTMFLIDMDNRKIYICSAGSNYEVITDKKAEIITDNVYRYASDGDYYGCAEKAFMQIDNLLSGQKIAEPMRYISNVVISLVLGFLLTFMYVLTTMRIKKASRKKILNASEASVVFANVVGTKTGTHKVYSPVESSSSGGSSGGGFSGGGGGGGGGFSGGGGGHSF